MHMLTAVAAALTGCAGQPPVDIEAGTDDCPDLNGSWCTVGQYYEAGDTEVTMTQLHWYLPVANPDQGEPVNRVELRGVTDGALTIVLWAGDTEVARSRLTPPELRCGRDAIVFQRDAVGWASGGLPVFGAGKGWYLLQRAADGTLRISQYLRESGAIVVIPVSWKREMFMRFAVAGDTACPASQAE